MTPASSVCLRLVYDMTPACDACLMQCERRGGGGGGGLRFYPSVASAISDASDSVSLTLAF